MGVSVAPSGDESEMGTVAWVLAAAGSGSSGFSGGGGGGGGGGGSSSGGSYVGGGGGGAMTLGWWIALGALVAVVALCVFLGPPVRRRFVRRRARVIARRVARADAARAAREQEVVPAALDAAQDDAAFDPEPLKREAEELFRAVQHAWTHDHNGLAALVEPDLLEEWRRRLEGLRKQQMFNRVAVEGPVHVRLVAVRNAEEESADRAVVFVSAVTTDVVSLHGNRHTVKNRKGQWGPHVALTEYWTLGRREGRWVLVSVEQAEEGAHHLRADLIARPEQDGSLRDVVVGELATADAVAGRADQGAVATLVDVDLADDARAAALDLSLVDGRFAPEVLEAAARRVVAGWLEAVDGPDDALHAVAEAEAVRDLLHPGTIEERVVVRGAAVEGVRIAALDGDVTPPRMSLEVALRGRRYVEDRTTAAVLDGSPEREQTWRERWTLALSGEAATPWRLVAADPPPADAQAVSSSASSAKTST